MLHAYNSSCCGGGEVRGSSTSAWKRRCSSGALSLSDATSAERSTRSSASHESESTYTRSMRELRRCAKSDPFCTAAEARATEQRGQRKSSPTGCSSAVQLKQAYQLLSCSTRKICPSITAMLLPKFSSVSTRGAEERSSWHNAKGTRDDRRGEGTCDKEGSGTARVRALSWSTIRVRPSISASRITATSVSLTS